MIGIFGKPTVPGSLLDPHPAAADHASGRRWAIPDARALLDRARRWSVPLRASPRAADPALTLDLPERTLRVRSPKVLEFVLASRTQFPVSRLMKAMGASPRRLEWESARMRDTERRLSAMLTRALQQPGLLGEQLRELGLRAFSKDHGWRDIMENLMRLSPEFDEYKRIAVIKYLQYLRSRQRALKGIFMDKTRDMDTAVLHATVQCAGAEQDLAAHGELCDPDADGAPAAAPLRSLPKGETMCIRFAGHDALRLVLAGNPFSLERGGRHFTLVDDAGTRLPLQPGKNVVGRHADCQVRVDPACRSVSRQHVVLEPLSQDMVLVTDVSAHGTQVPAKFL